MQLARSRPLFFLAFIACALVICMALYLEYEEGLTPCALCILQRIFVVAFGIMSLVAYLHAPGQLVWRIYSSMLLLFALAGAVTAGRQVWLQTLPPQDLLSCVPGFEYLFETMAVNEAISRLFMGGINCDEVSWTLLEMSVPEWSLLAFAGLIMFATYQLFQREPARLDPE
ncbi:disulfide bond formation protein B [Pseudomonas sp. MH10]|uniref:disulfide bond formation protein B n=1 Tax=Pseudomonas sp. MH10 TaxID=3048627 RepID=UPI002AC9D8B8|nr:disulfide bond formation protein B [Pseudomonas sp. MH10]MEB0041566.1 disulfide bond formation protein B [Pseudomonas sp. MH10]WPX62787.1 disulfide bond formation protein B [Pseudomonas sp. MH10]